MKCAGYYNQMYTLLLLSLHLRLHFVLRRIHESRSFPFLLDMMFHCVSTYLFLSFLFPQPPSWVSGELWRCDLNIFRIERFLLFFMKLIFNKLWKKSKKHTWWNVLEMYLKCAWNWNIQAIALSNSTKCTWNVLGIEISKLSLCQIKWISSRNQHLLLAARSPPDIQKFSLS